MTHAALKDRDPNKPNTEQGLFRKFDVFRTDLSDQPGGKHHGCEYFVLDLTHDPHAKAALAAYAVAVNKTHPQLAADLCQRYDLSAMEGEAVAYFAASPAEGSFERYATFKEAKDCAAKFLEWEADEAADSGWCDEPPQVCYGVILGECEEVPGSRRLADQPGDNGDFGEIVDFRLTNLGRDYTAPPPQQAASDEDAAEKYRVAWQAGRDAQKAEQAATQPQQAGGDDEAYFYRTECALYRGKIDLLMAEVSQADEDGRAFIHKDTITAIITHAATPPQPEAGGGDDNRNLVRSALTTALGDAMDCTRVWDAWRVGTMTEDDFCLISEDSDRLEEIVDAVLAALSTTPTSGGEHG